MGIIVDKRIIEGRPLGVACALAMTGALTVCFFTIRFAAPRNGVDAFAPFLHPTHSNSGLSAVGLLPRHGGRAVDLEWT